MAETLTKDLPVIAPPPRELVREIGRASCRERV